MNAAPSRGAEHCLFVRHDRTFALSTELAREIAEARPTTPLPHAPRALLGAVNLHGEILGLVSLDGALGLEGRGEGGATIVLCRGDLKFGVEVDRITGIRSLFDEDIGALPEDPPIARGLALGRANIDGAEVIVLDADALLHEILESMATGGDPSPRPQSTGFSLE